MKSIKNLLKKKYTFFKYKFKYNNIKVSHILIFVVSIILLTFGFSFLSSSLNISSNITYKKYISYTLDTYDNLEFRNEEYINKIVSVTFNDSINIPSDAIESWDVSDIKDNSVMAYIIENEDDDSKYDLYIESNGNIYGNSDSSNLFLDFINIKNINGLNHLDTSKVINMNSMFKNCSSLITIDVDSFNINKVTNMEDMFYNCTSLENIYCNSNWYKDDLLSNNMFYNCLVIKGGNGTIYNDNILNATYARVDLDEDNRGYFANTSCKETKQLTFSSTLGNISMNPITMNHWDEVIIPDYVPTELGYTFKEWNTKEDGTGESYNNNDVFKNTLITPTDDMVLYAIWEDFSGSKTLNGNLNAFTSSPSGAMQYALIYNTYTLSSIKTDGNLNISYYARIYNTNNWYITSSGDSITLQYTINYVDINEENKTRNYNTSISIPPNTRIDNNGTYSSRNNYDITIPDFDYTKILSVKCIAIVYFYNSYFQHSSYTNNTSILI